jgi:hypothetical protein
MPGSVEFAPSNSAETPSSVNTETVESFRSTELDPGPNWTVVFRDLMPVGFPSLVAFTVPVAERKTRLVETCSVDSSPVLCACVWRNPAVLIRTPAAIAATNTRAIKTMSVPIPT